MNIRAVLRYMFIATFVFVCSSLLYLRSKYSITFDRAYNEAKQFRQRLAYSVLSQHGVETNFTVERISSTACENILQAQNMTGYLKFFKLEKLNMCCSSCAFVSSSGQLLAKNSGSEIDSKQCVVRDNHAPFGNFEKDVGSRTDIRMVSHTSVGGLINYLKKYPGGKSEITNTTFVFWGPDKKMIEGGSTYRQLESLRKTYPTMTIYALTPDQMNYADDTFEKETGRPRRASGSYLSTGWFTMLLLREICAETHVYGMINETYCDDMKKNNVTDAPYHYYSERDGKECNLYFRHEKARGGAHRFITEKRVFKRWSEEDKNIYFHAPEWK